jgi:hypothetical protein
MKFTYHYLAAASGGSIDWTRGVANITYSIALELPPGQTGVDSSYGFTLPVIKFSIISLL